MSREYYQAVALMHQDNAERFVANADEIKRHVECRIDDLIYVYLYEGDIHIQTQHVTVPDDWWDNWPSNATVATYISMPGLATRVLLRWMRESSIEDDLERARR